jgi:hypothetical protein
MTELWFKRSCGLGQDPDMQAVALAHGGVAVLVFEELMALSKITRGAGRVSTTWDVIALRCYAKKPLVKAVIESLDEHHLVVIDADQTTGDAVTLSVQGWSKWNPKDPTNADRQRRHRNGARNGVRNGGAVPVTALEVEEEKENREPPLPPKGNRARDRVLYEQEMADYSAWLLPDAPEPDRTQLVNAACSWMRSRTSIQGPVSTSHVLLWLRQHAPEHVPEENAA